MRHLPNSTRRKKPASDSSILADYSEILGSICREWDTAERDIKIAEQIGDQVVFPSIKELRYAGRRIVDALNALARGEDSTRITALLEDARFDCYRARHDAVDATISIVSAELNVAAKKLKYGPVLSAFPRYSELLGHIRRAQENLAKSRSNRHDRDAIYGAVEEANFEQIVVLFRDFRESNSVMKSLAKRERWKSVINFASISFGIIGVAIGLISLM